jgi:hypothetical protein
MMARPDICTNKEKVTYGAQTNCHASTGAYMINANRNKNSSLRDFQLD